MHGNGERLRRPDHREPDTYKTGVHEIFARKLSPPLLKWHDGHGAASLCEKKMKSRKKSDARFQASKYQSVYNGPDLGRLDSV